MAYQVELDEFQGPLDLLLGLIEQHDLDIADICLAQVTDQYLRFVETNEDIPPENLVDFLFIASRLLLIKSRLVLPSLEEDEEESNLAAQLKIYKEYLEASKIVKKMIDDGRDLLWPQNSPIKLEPVFFPPMDLDGEDYENLFKKVVDSLEKFFVLPQALIKKTISLKEKILQIKNVLADKNKMVFSQVVDMAKDRHDVVISFLALLELIKQKQVIVSQDEIFKDIFINKTGLSFGEEEQGLI